MCHSKEVSSRGAISKEALSPNFVCLSCGFQSPVFPEFKLEDAEKFPDHPKNFTPSRMPLVADGYKDTGQYRKYRYTAIAVLAILLYLLLR